ncbi:elongation factor-like GTPase 1 [Tanacetum coccineum]|uniref:Elongation factor-like GTPase 1 n=1 Tax=Tanacetum coccineum TaxID=301880 RepID=A0ABQ5ERC6_9ASTR
MEKSKDRSLLIFFLSDNFKKKPPPSLPVSCFQLVTTKTKSLSDLRLQFSGYYRHQKNQTRFFLLQLGQTLDPFFLLAVDSRNRSRSDATVGNKTCYDEQITDSFVEISVSAKGEHVLVVAGEVHLERCIKDLKDRFEKVDLVVSPPLMSFRETIEVEMIMVFGGAAKCVPYAYRICAGLDLANKLTHRDPPSRLSSLLGDRFSVAWMEDRFIGRGLNLSFFKCFEPYPIRPRYDNAWAQAKRHLSFLFVGKVQKVIWTGKSQSSQGD